MNKKKKEKKTLFCAVMGIKPAFSGICVFCFAVNETNVEIEWRFSLFIQNKSGVAEEDSKIAQTFMTHNTTPGRILTR